MFKPRSFDFGTNISVFRRFYDKKSMISFWIFTLRDFCLICFLYKSGWWLSHPSEKYEFVSWDYSSQLNGKIKNVPSHQPDKMSLVGSRWCLNVSQMLDEWWKDLGVGQNLLLSILMGWTSIYQLFWGSPGVQGFDTLPSEKILVKTSGLAHMGMMWND